MTERLEAPPECYEKGNKGDRISKHHQNVMRRARRMTESLEAPPECYAKGKKGD